MFAKVLIGNLLIRQAIIGLEKDFRVKDLTRGMATAGCEACELFSFFFGEIDDVAFHLYYLHELSPMGTVFGLSSTISWHKKRLDVWKSPRPPFSKGEISRFTRQSKVD